MSRVRISETAYFFFFFFFFDLFFFLCFFFLVIIITVQICKFNITVSTQFPTLLLLMMPRPPAPSAL